MRSAVQGFCVLALVAAALLATTASPRAEDLPADHTVAADKAGAQTARKKYVKRRASRQTGVYRYRETEAEKEAAREAQRLITREYLRK